MKIKKLLFMVFFSLIAGFIIGYAVSSKSNKDELETARHIMNVQSMLYKNPIY